MKRLLMITSAVGLCLAAPAFAQTTEQDQTNRPRATQPSNSAPAAQSQERQRPNQDRPNQGGQAQQSAPSSPSPSAQAPSDQNKQAQQPASGSSSSSAQAPSNQNQNQTGQAQRPTSAQAPSDQKPSGRAQNQRQPAGKTNEAQAPADQQQRTATDRNQPARSGQAQTRQSQQRQDAKTSRDRSSASVNINETQLTRISAAFSSINARPVKVNFNVAVGVAVPRTVVLHTVPSTIVEIAPQFRGYSYFVTGEEIVIVEPKRKTVVAVLPAGGTARAQAPASNRVSFSDEQREVIRKRASTLRSTATTGSASRIVVEEEVPATIELQEFPVEIVTEVPTVREYRYFRQDNDVVVVDPGRRRVIEVIR